MDKINKESDINIRIESSIKEEYKKHCKLNKTKISKEIRTFILKELWKNDKE